jgi:hypothetical protein
MNLKAFEELVKENVSIRLGSRYEVTINKITKNNDTILSGLTIRQGDLNISPTIYLNEYYEGYENGRYTLYSIVNHIIETYKKNKTDKSVDMKFFLDFDSVRPFIVHRIINTERNKDFLKDVPHVEFLDLSIVFMAIINGYTNYKDGLASITVTNSHCKIWEIGIDELIFTARQNTPRLMPATLKTMDEILMKAKASGAEDIPTSAYGSNMMVVSNNYGLYGASTMLDKNYLRDLSDAFGSNYYILPSSIHELIVLVDNFGTYSEELKEVVRSINATMVDPVEVLSDSVYYFDRENDRLLVL